MFFLKKLGILCVIFTTLLFLLIVACPEENNPPATTTTTTITPADYQGSYFKKYSTGTPPQPDKITITGTKVIYERWDGSKYALFFEANISSFNNNILTSNLTKLSINGNIKTIPGLIWEDPSIKQYITSYTMKYKFVEKIINSKKCYYVENIYNGGSTTDLTGTWKYQEYEDNITFKTEQDIGGGNILTYYTYNYTKMPEITFTSNKMFFKGYKYGRKENNPASQWIWYTFDVTADCTIDIINKTIELGNIEATNNQLPSWVTLTKGEDYPEETTSDKYVFEIVDNYLVFPWKKDNKMIFYFEKQ